MSPPEGTLRLSAPGAAATIALRGAEPVSWNVAGRECLWSGDPEHWAYRAPILFPVVGASRGGVVRVDGVAHPMPQHGFARTSDFALVDRSPATARLRLLSCDETLSRYPYPFALDVVASLEPDSLSLGFEVRNTGERPMPYGLGFHPAFPWPLGPFPREAHVVAFERPERSEVPEVAAGGLLARRTRTVPLAGRTLPLAPGLFTEALVFLDARSRAMSFEAPSGAAITLETDSFPHLAIWSRPTAPFLSLEAWTGHADWEDAAGELADRASMIMLPPGGIGRHLARMSMREPPAGA